MTYGSLQGLLNRFNETELAQVTNRTDTSVIDEAIVAAALAEADGMIDGYLAARYQLPLASVPPLISTIAVTITGWLLLGASRPDNRPNYTDAIATLRDIAKGALLLDVAGKELATGSPNSPMLSMPARTFSRSSLRDF